MKHICNPTHEPIKSDGSVLQVTQKHRYGFRRNITINNCKNLQTNDAHEAVKRQSEN
jgi:hypothetical protein